VRLAMATTTAVDFWLALPLVEIDRWSETVAAEIKAAAGKG